MKAIMAAAVVLFSAVAMAGGAEVFQDWESVGPGGGGGNFRIAVSPYDSELYFTACDMGGFYRSEDGGATWRMIDGIMQTTTPAVFDPADDSTVYVAHMIGEFMNNGWGISKSEDRGETWERLYGITGDYATNSVTCLTIDPHNTLVMYVGTAGEKPGRLLRSDTGGRFWKTFDEGIPESETIGAIYIQDVPKTVSWAGFPPKRLVAVGRSGVYRRDDQSSGKWVLCAGGLPEGVEVAASCQAGMDIYVATSGEGGGVGRHIRRLGWKSQGWEEVSSPFAVMQEEAGKARDGKMVAIAASRVSDEVLYCAVNVPGEPVRGGIWKSEDAGATWRYVLMGESAENILGEKRGEGSKVETGWLTKEFSWWWGDVPITADQLAVCASDADVVLRQDFGRTIGSTDGGETWRQLYADHVGGRRWKSRGYEVTTCYEVYWRGDDLDKMFIAYTDIGLFRSEDGGASWIYSLEGTRHRNTVYEMAIDPEKPERIWAATSSSHDMPYWKTLDNERYYSRGGVAISQDGGESWRPVEGTGLENASCNSIVLDAKSAVDSRALYVTQWHYGVYKSTDGGKTWERKVEGIDLERDYNFWRTSMGADGALYLTTTKTIEPREGDGRAFGPGAIYRSDDGAESWKKLPGGDWSVYPWDIVCDPKDAGVVYVASKADPHVERGRITPGGVWRSSDRGETWERILENVAPQRITVDAADTKRIFVGTEYDAVLRSDDGGKVWNRVEGISFKNCYKVSIDPRDRERVYVTTFGGGVWRGSAYGTGREAPNR